MARGGRLFAGGLAGLGVGVAAFDAWRVRQAQVRAAAVAHLARDHDAVVGEGLGEPVELVVLGDSAADGYGLTDPASAFPRQLALRVAARTTRRVRVRSWAISGARTADLTVNQAPVLRAARPDLVVASCGVNDVVHRTPLDQLRDDTAALLVALATHAPLADHVLVGCPDLSRAPGIAWPLSRVVRRRCRGVAAVQAEVAAAAGVTFAALDPAPGPALFGDDGFHPGPAAQAEMAERTVAAMAARAAAESRR